MRGRNRRPATYERHVTKAGFNKSAAQKKRVCCVPPHSRRRPTLSITSCSRRSAGRNPSLKVGFPLRMWKKGGNIELLTGMFVPKATPVRCRETFYIRGRCSSPTTGSVSTPKSLAETPRFDLRLCSSVLWFTVPDPDVSVFHQISIPVPTVTFIKKTKTALLVPNALVIETASCQVKKSASRLSFKCELGPTHHFCFFFALPARLCVLPVSKHHLQISEVHLPPFGGICLPKCVT